MKSIVEFVAILLLNLSSESNVSARISDARLIGIDAKGGIGVVQVLQDGTWKSVCRRGNDKYDQSWGNKEAAVVCRQLGYQGGWTWEALKFDHKTAAFQLIDDFRCLGDEPTLDQCYHDRRQYVRGTSGCGENNYAGAQCFASFQVRLIGGAKPSAGRVQLKYNNEWTNVCFNSKKNRGWRDWGFYEVQVVCRELGYPGALMKQRGGYGDGQGWTYINGFKCIGNEKSLKDCVSDSPVDYVRHQRYICGPRNEAIAICADPGYSGCYTYRRFPPGVILDRIQSPKMTVRLCIEYCRQKRHRYSALFEGHICYCGTKDLLIHAGRLPDTKCRDPCGGNDNEICGGYNVLSVYDVDRGMCMDPFNQSISYYFGDVVNNVICDTGYEMYGASSVQCIMGDSWNETKWSGPFPSCREQTGQELRTSRYTLTAIWVAVACFSLLAAATIIVAEFTIGRTCKRAKAGLVAKTLRNSLCSIRQSIMAPSEPVYESSMQSLNMLNLYTMRTKYQRSSFTEERYQMGRVMGRSQRSDAYNQRRAVFRNSDDDVVAYTIRTKL